MVVNITTIHFHYQVVTILGSDVHFNSSDVHYSVFTVYVEKVWPNYIVVLLCHLDVTTTLGYKSAVVITKCL